MKIELAIALLAACSSHDEPARSANPAAPPARPVPTPPDAPPDPPPPRASMPATDTKLATLAGATPIVEAAFASRTGIVWGAGIVAWVERRGSGVHVVVNGRAGRAFDAIEQLDVGRDGVVTYVGTDAAGAHVVHGGDLGPAYGSALILHDADWRDPPFVYLARRGPSQVLVVDGVAGPAVTDVDITRLDWLPDHQPAYAAKLDTDAHVVIGKDVGSAYTHTGYLQVTDGQLGYDATDATGAYAFVGRTAGKRYDEIDGLRLGPGGIVGYEGKRGEKRFAVIGTHEEGPYDRVVDIAFAGAHHAYAARIGERWFVVADGTRGPSYHAIAGAPVFDAHGAHVAYVAYTQDDHLGPEVVVRDGRPEPKPWTAIQFPTWSADGAHLAYEASSSDDKAHVVLDGVAGPPLVSVGGLQFGADGVLHYEARRDRDWCVISGPALACYADIGEPNMIAADDRLNFILDPTGKHVAFRARVEGGWVVIVDGKPVGAPANELTELSFSADGTLVRWGAREGEDLWWRVARVAR